MLTNTKEAKAQINNIDTEKVDKIRYDLAVYEKMTLRISKIYHEIERLAINSFNKSTNRVLQEISAKQDKINDIIEQLKPLDDFLEKIEDEIEFGVFTKFFQDGRDDTYKIARELKIPRNYVIRYINNIIDLYYEKA